MGVRSVMMSMGFESSAGNNVESAATAMQRVPNRLMVFVLLISAFQLQSHKREILLLPDISPERTRKDGAEARGMRYNPDTPSQVDGANPRDHASDWRLAARRSKRGKRPVRSPVSASSRHSVAMSAQRGARPNSRRDGTGSRGVSSLSQCGKPDHY